MENPIILSGSLDSELRFSFSRSSGPGGQHVNKVNTKAELRFNVHLSAILNNIQKEKLEEKLSHQISQDGELIIVAQASRSQAKNRQAAIEKFYALINKALTPKKKRKPTSATKAAKEKRLKAKKELSEKKSRRRFDENTNN